MGLLNRESDRVCGVALVPRAGCVSIFACSELGAGGVLRVCRGFLDHERAAWVDLPWFAEVFDVVEGVGREVVDADAVVGRVDGACSAAMRRSLVGVAADDLED